MSDKGFYGYVAGLIDGEGTITIYRGSTPCYQYWKGVRSEEKKHHGIRFTPKISIKNTDKRLMEWLKSRLGGEYYSSKNAKKPTWKDSHVWMFTSETNKEQFLLAVLPYLVVKRKQALVLLEFLRLGSVRDPAKRQELYEKITFLNRRGKPVETNTIAPSSEGMIESVLIGDDESTPTVT